MATHWETPSTNGLLLLIAVGLAGGTAQIIMKAAIKSTTIAILMSFEYTGLLWLTGFAIATWNVSPTPKTLWDAFIVATTGFNIVHAKPA